MHYFNPMLTKWYKWIPMLIKNPKWLWGSIFSIGAIIYIKIWLPRTQIGIPCIFHEITGLYCPGCGITRSLTQLLQFRFEEAFRYHPLLFFFVPLYLLYSFTARIKWKRTSQIVLGILLFITIVFGIFRNIPGFEWLTPQP